LPPDVGGFSDQFEQAMLRTKHVYFALDGTGYPDLSATLYNGAQGWGNGKDTNVELYQILNNREWYEKTDFYFDGEELTEARRPPFGIRE